MDERIIKNIKALGMDMIAKASSGHPGIVLGAAPILYTLYSRHMHSNVSDLTWANRDRFILSAGHGSALLYAILYMAGLDYTVEDLKQFRQIHSKTPGHPEYGMSPFIEASTGPLGQGIGNAVGIALNQKIQEVCSTSKDLIDYYTYVLCGDGDLMEGISYEASSFAGTNGLDHLIILYDANQISLDGTTNQVFDEDILKRFESMQFYVDEVEKGEDVEAIDRAIKKAKASKKPSLIKIHTTIGKGSILENTNRVHGLPLSREDSAQLKQKWNWPVEPFFVDKEARAYFQNQLKERTVKKYQIWQEQKKDLTEKQILALDGFDYGDYSLNIDFKEKESLRDSNGRVLNHLAANHPNFLGGSADLGSSTKTNLTEFSTINRDDFNGRNIAFGVREHAMGAILNGLALCKYKVFGSTFLSFSDYLKPSIRLAALMHLPVTYIFTHDSVLVGEDGPTHQPIEQLAMLRSIPELYVFRPSDIKEVIGAWKYILANPNHPSVLILSRTEVRLKEMTNENEVQKGAYIIKKETEKLDAVIIATGTEVDTALAIANELEEEQLHIRVVSMPCMERWKEQSRSYKNEVLPPKAKIFVIEAATSMGWEGFTQDQDSLFTIDHFGYSGKAEDVLQALSFTKEVFKTKIIKKLKENLGGFYE